MTGEPLGRVTSIKVKLGLLVAASVVCAAVVGTLGAAGGVTPWLAIPVTVAIALGVTQLLAAGMTSPLRQMTEVAHRMARGDYSGRVDASAGDELGELARTFNQMATDLGHVHAERRALVATVSHELRTPLAALTARLENLADGVEEPDDDTLAGVLAQARRLGGLVDDLLDLSRVDAGVTPLRLDDLDVAAFLAEIVDTSTPPTRGVTYSVSAPPGLVVRADPARLRQLVTNLLDNAARHSPTGGLVAVRVTPGPSSWILEVADSGPGVHVDDRERVFERFGTLAGHEGGTGLGLAIARWVADLHDGSVRFIDPEPGSEGARVVVTLPLQPVTTTTTPRTPGVTRMAATPPTPALPVPAVAAVSTPPLIGPLFGAFWPEEGVTGRRDLVLAAVGVGVLAGVVLPFRAPGLALFLVLVTATAVLAYAARHRRDPFTVACLVSCALLCLPVLLLDAAWISTLCWLAGGGIALIGVTRGSSVPSFVLAGLAWPLASLRGLPWFGRTLQGLAGRGSVPALLRTLVWSLLAVVVFGLLFASADALVASWLGALVPDWTIDTFVLRVFVSAATFGLLLAGAYLALNPPRTQVADLAAPRTVRHRYEWLTPVLLVDAVFGVFLVAQATVVFGGHDYVERTTGLTYADYVHQGFGQLTVATALTLLVVWAASRKAARTTPADQLALRGSLGALCLMTLVVVASALFRMGVYQDAYGFTQLRLLVDVFEGWLGLLVLAVLVAGVRLDGRWVPRAALFAGAAALAGLALVNPDAWIARHNIDRFQATGKIDVGFLSTLSADAVPELVRLPGDVRACVLPDRSTSHDDWLAWNLGRDRARAALRGTSPVGATATCSRT
jgi:signal transduction histidine kinase